MTAKPSKIRRKLPLPDLDKVESLAGQGLNKKQIAAALNIDYLRLLKLQRENKEFEQAIFRGHSKGVAKVANALFIQAMKGNVTAQMFYLKARGDWRENQSITLPGQGTGELPVKVQVEFVKSKDKDKPQKTIDEQEKEIKPSLDENTDT